MLRAKSIVNNAKLRNFEYFRGIAETPLFTTPLKRASSGESSSKRSLSEAFESADGHGECNSGGRLPKAEKKRKKSEKESSFLQVTTAEDAARENKAAQAYLEGTYPYGEYLTEEQSIRDLGAGDDSDATIAYDNDSDATIPYDDADIEVCSLCMNEYYCHVNGAEGGECCFHNCDCCCMYGAKSCGFLNHAYPKELVPADVYAELQKFRFSF